MYVTHRPMIKIEVIFQVFFLDSVKQQAITRATIEPDLCRHVASLLTGPQWVKSYRMVQ